MENKIKKYIDLINIDKNGRYHSFDNIREAFIKYKDDKGKRDYLALQLYTYLASWGMLRNSFLLQKDYKFNIPVIDLLCNKKYNSLNNLSVKDKDIDAKINLIFDLSNEIKKYYTNQYYYEDGSNNKIKIKNVTNTLITKILLGTLGCVPAYDRYFVKAIKANNICGTFNKKSLKQLIEFAKNNYQRLTDIKSSIKNYSYYTDMKIIDMYFWELGFKD